MLDLRLARPARGGKDWSLLVIGGTLLAILIVFSAFTGCASSPEQKTSVAVQPDAATKAALSDIQAKVVKLDQQNQQLTTTVTQAIQRTETFGNEVKGGIASLTQNQFRVESWLAESTDHLRLRVLGFDRFTRDVPGPGSDAAGIGARVSPGGVAHVGSAGVGAPARSSVLTRLRQGYGGQEKWRPTMLELLVAFLLGALLSSVVLGILGALHQVLADHILAKIGVIVAWLWAKLLAVIGVFKPAAKPTPAAPAASTAPKVS